MKKVLQISIAQTLFTIEEDAYASLSDYLATIHNHFAQTEGSEDIIADIETRIAEQLHESKEKIVTEANVARVIERMGRVEDFGDANENTGADTKEKTAGASAPARKIYRDPDNAIIAGVASGLAAFWNIDPLWVRIAFIVLAFFNGIGIIAYVVLWLILPPAKTSSQKLEMTGTPVTLATLSETARERIAEVRSKGRLEYILSFPFIIIGHVLRFFVRTIGPILRIGIGAGLVAGALGFLVFAMIGSGFIFSDTLWLTENVSLRELFPGGFTHWVIVAGGMLAFIIPAFFVLIGGIALILKRAVMSSYVVFPVLGVWFIALLISGFGVAKIAQNYTEGVSNKSNIAMSETVIPLDGVFDKVEIAKDIDMTIVRSATTSLSARGRETELPSLEVRVENGTLYIDRTHVVQEKMCMFCENETIEMTLTVPSLTEVRGKYGISLYSNDFPAANSVRLELAYGARGDLELKTDTVLIDLLQGAELSLRGNATNTDASLEYGSNLSARNFVTEFATTTASNGSTVELEVQKTLNASALFGGEVIYTGNPSVTEAEEFGGSVRKRGERLEEEYY